MPNRNSASGRAAASGRNAASGRKSNPSIPDRHWCLDFDGSNDYVKVTNNFIVNPSALTMEAWFMKESGGSNYECVIHKSSNASIGASDYWLGVCINDYLTATIGANTSVGWAAGKTTTLATYGQWYHLAATWDGSVVIVYIDGAYNKQYNLSTYTNLNTDTRFGASSDGANYQFRGKIDGIRIYDAALSAAEIKKHYEGDFSSDPTANLKGCWHFDGTTGSTLYDSSGDDNNGTIYGATYKLCDRLDVGLVAHWKLGKGTQTGASTQADITHNNNDGTLYNTIYGTDNQGNVDSACDLSGTSSYIACGADSSLDITDEITISMWIRPDSVAEYTISKNDQSAADHQYAIYLSSTARYYPGGNPISGTITNSVWSHLVFTRTGGNGQFYINGVASGSSAACSMPSRPTFPVRLGCRWNVGTTPHLCFNGKIDEVRIYSRALSIDEIKQLYYHKLNN